jgi:hypothetical protein
MKRPNLRVVTARSGDAGTDRGRPGGRGGIPARRRAAGPAGAGRGDPGGRRDQLAAAVAAVGDRARDGCCGVGHPGVAGQPQCGRPPERPSGSQLHLVDEGADLQRRAAALVGQAAIAGMQYLLGGHGPLAKSRSTTAAGSSAPPGQSRPNMQLYMQAFSTLIPRKGERPLLTPDPWSGLSMGLSNCRPTSRGISASGADPGEHPAITANAFSTETRCDRDAGRGEVPAQDRGATGGLARLIRRNCAPGRRL